jgi:hypothetical protein
VEPKGSLSCLQEPRIGPYPYVTHIHFIPHFLISLQYYYLIYAHVSNVAFYFFLFHPMCATRPTHFILIDLISVIISSTVKRSYNYEKVEMFDFPIKIVTA